MTGPTDALVRRNRLRVLDAIRTGGPVARVDIAEASGLSRATVSTLTASLIGDGLVREVEASETADAPRERGRPRVLLDVEPAAHHAYGVRLATSGIELALSDFAGTVVARRARRHRGPPPPARDVAALVADTLADLARETGLAPGDAAGVGVGLPGFIDARTGFCTWSPALGDREVAMRALLEEAIGCPVALDNDANLAALATRDYGIARGVRDFALVTLGHGLDQGVGMALVVDGRVQRPRGRAGSEFGHVKVSLGGPLCRCGRRGCIEAHVADYALLREARTSLDLREGPPETGPAIAALATWVRGGDAAALEIVERSGGVLGLGLANVVNLIAPPLVLVAGALDAPAFTRAMLAALEAEVVSASRGETRVVAIPLDADSYSRGAAALVYDELYPGLRPDA